jgi:hypothetical protein
MRFAFNRLFVEKGLITSTGSLVEVFYFWDHKLIVDVLEQNEKEFAETY